MAEEKANLEAARAARVQVSAAWGAGGRGCAGFSTVWTLIRHAAVGCET
jgi:hypothetical protein